jgi:hypothetical protein
MAKFSRWVAKNRLRKSVDRLKAELMINPDSGDVIPGARGLRKVRMAGLGRGKSGGFRVIYVLMLSRSVAVLLDGYSKSEKEDLSVDELNSLVADLSDAESLAEHSQQLQTEAAREQAEDETKND